MSLHTYSPKDVVLSFGAVVVSGYSDGTFISVERTEDAFTMVAGSDGDVTRSKNANRSGTVTLTLKASSPANNLLSALAAADEQVGSGVKPLIVKDNSGTTVVAAAKAWIRKMPVVEKAKEISDAEWMFDCASLTILAGGNNED